MLTKMQCPCFRFFGNGGIFMTTKRAPKDTYRYTYRDGYRGITRDPKRRAGEHRRAGRKGKMYVIKPPVTRERAREWERGKKR